MHRSEAEFVAFVAARRTHLRRIAYALCGDSRGGEYGALRVVFYDKAGDVLVDDRDPGHIPDDDSLSIANFPSLAWWLK